MLLMRKTLDLAKDTFKIMLRRHEHTLALEENLECHQALDTPLGGGKPQHHFFPPSLFLELEEKNLLPSTPIEIQIQQKRTKTKREIILGRSKRKQTKSAPNRIRPFENACKGDTPWKRKEGGGINKRGEPPLSPRTHFTMNIRSKKKK